MNNYGTGSARERNQMRADMRLQSAMGKKRQRDDRRNADALAYQNRRNAATAIRGTYGRQAAVDYMAGRNPGGPAGMGASQANALGLSNNAYINQRNRFATDDANRYATRTNADANYLTGRGNLLAGQGAADDPHERTWQAQIAGDASRYGADRVLAGTYDTNDTTRQGNALSYDLGRHQVAGQERVALIEGEAKVTAGALEADAPDAIVPLGEGTAYYDRRLGRAVSEGEQAQQAIQMQRQQDAVSQIQELVRQHPDEAAKIEAEHPDASDEEKLEMLRRSLEFVGGDKNAFNRSFWQNPANLANASPLGAAGRWLGLY